MGSSRFLKKYFILVTMLSSWLGLKAQPNADFSINAPFPNCNPAVYSFTNSSTGTAPLIYEWNFGVYPGINSIFENPGTTYIGCGDFDVKLVVIDGLGQKDSIIKRITVRCSPRAYFTTTSLTGCIPYTATFDDSSTAGSGNITSYFWDFGDGYTGNEVTPSHTYTETGCKNLTLIVTNTYNCTNDTTINNLLCVQTPPVADFTSDDSASCSAPFDVTYSALVSGGSGNYSYQWIFEGGDSSTDENPTVTYSSAGEFTTKLIVTDATGCTDTVTKIGFIKISDNSADITVSKSEGCTSDIFSAQGIAANDVTSWQWAVTPSATIYGDDSDRPYFTFDNGGSYNVCLTITYSSGCTASKCTTVVVHDNPSAHFNYSGLLNTCIRPDTISFINTSTGNNLTYNWSFPGASPSSSTDENPSITYNNCGNYSSALTVTDSFGCQSTYTENNFATIYCPAAAFTIRPSSGCYPLTVSFSDSGSTGQPVSWSWDFGDTTSGNDNTSILQSPTHTYNQKGCYTVTLTTVNAEGCTATVTLPAAVCAGDKPLADFTGSPTINCANLPVLFTNLSDNVDSNTVYAWDFHGDDYNIEGTGANPSYTYGDTGVWDVTLVVSNFGCTDTVRKIGLIETVPPIAVPEINRNCDNYMVVTLDGSSSAGALAYTWVIPGGSPSTASTPAVTVTYSAEGTYSAQLTVFNDSTGCSDTQEINFNIQNLKSDFTGSPLAGCAPLNSCMNNISSGASSYNWIVTDTSGATVVTSTSANPCFTFNEAGIYNVRLIAYNSYGCSDTLDHVKYITVYRPEANFHRFPVNGCPPLTVNFTDSSYSSNTTLLSWEWNFGDNFGPGSFSSLQNPSHTFNLPGDYTVRLTVTDSQGCTNTAESNIQVIKPMASFTASNTVTCRKTQICFTNNSTGSGLSYQWNFGDGHVSSSESPCHVYDTTGKFTVTLIATNSSGCKDTASYPEYIQVTKPIASFEADTTSSSCPPMLVSFTNLSSTSDAHTTYLWKFGDGQVSSAYNPSHIYNLPGDFDVTLIATNENGCKDTMTIENYIHVSGPIANISTPPTSGCTPHYTCLSAISSTTISFVWNFGDGSVQSIGDSVCYSYTRTGNFYPELILNDGAGCIYAMPVGVVSINDVVAMFKTTDSVFCTKTVQFTDSSYGTSSIQSRVWDFGDPLSGSNNSSTLKNPTHTFSAPGIYQVTETVTSVSGCSHAFSRNITINDSPVISSISADADTCSAHIATATVNISGGNPVYQYVWNTVPVQSSATVTGLSGNKNYTVTVTDMNGCSTSDSVTITDLHKPVFTISVKPATCELSNGSVTALVSSGNSPYSYNWNSGTYTSPSVSNLPAGNYSVVITDRFGCTAVRDTSIIDIPKMTINSSVSDASCGNQNGVITLTVADGSSPYTYLWNNGKTTGNINNLGASVYTVTVTDLYNCTAIDSFSVNGMDPLTLSHSYSNTSCGSDNGSIIETVTGGTMPYTYSWNNGTFNSKDLSNLTAGTYTLFLSDSAGCSALDTVIIQYNLPPELSSGANSAACGRNNGYAWVSVSGGIEPFTYLWSNGDTNDNTDSLFSGNYTVTVTDSSGCTAVSSVTVSDLPGPSVSYSTIPPSCGLDNGIIILTISGGAFPYNYEWSNGENTEDISNLSAGTYFSTITDGNGCEVITTVVLNGATPPLLSFNKSDASCDLNNGTASVTVTGGTSPYTFLWSNGDVTENISGIPAGTYSLQLTDSSGCTQSGSVVINSLSSAPAVTVTPATAICLTKSTTLVASGAITYNWLPSTGLNKTTGSTVTAQPVVTTTYTVNGTTLSGCSGSATVVITVHPSPVITVTGNAVICPGTTAMLTASGAATYKWVPSTALNNTSGSIVVSSPSVPITYTVTGTDVFGCSSSTTIHVSKTSNPVISLTPDNPVLCYGNAATMNASGALTYIWSPASGLNQTSGASVVASPTVTTSYTVTGTDMNGCTSSVTTIITSISPTPVDAGAGGTICIGNSLPLQGSGAIQYNWSPAAGLSNSTIFNPVASPTVTTTYYLTGSVPTGNLITNGSFNAGNTGFSSAYTYATNLNPEGLYWVGKDAHTVHSNFFCKDHTTGSDNMMVVNGAPNPNVSVWCQTISVVPNSLYDFSTWVQTVSPAANPALLQFSVNGTMLGSPFAASPTLCNWQQFHATWNSGASTTASICIVNQNTIRNGNDFALDDISFSVLCQSVDSVVVMVNPAPVISATPSATSVCLGSGTNITASGASTYTWSPSGGLMTTTGSSVTASPTVTTTYTVTGIDVTGCTGSTTVTVNVFSAPTVSVNSTAPSFCYGGSSILTASGASAYSWTPATGLSGTNGSIVTAAPAATTTYTVTGTDMNGCTDTSTVIVTVLPAPNIVVTPSYTSICSGSSTTITASGAYTYLWSPDIAISPTTGSSVTVSPTITTSYTVIGTSSNGCTANAIAVVNVGMNFTINVISANASVCLGNSDTLSVTGASDYIWSPATGLNTTSGATVIAAPSVNTTYTVTGTDLSGCSGNGTAVITVNPLPVITVSPSGSDLCTGDSVLLIAAGASVYNWTPSINLNIISNDSVIVYPNINTTYAVRGTDLNGCSSSATVVINAHQPPLLSLTTGDTSLCFGESTTLTVSGASTYWWTPSATLSDSTGANVNAYPTETTSYYVTGKNSNGCESTDTIVLKVFPPVMLNVTPFNPTICNGSSVTLNAKGAENYYWSPAIGLNVTTGSVVTASPTVTTTYTVTGIDSTGCMGVNALIVTVGDFISLNVTVNPSALCQGDSAQLTVSGALIYTWNPASSLSSSTGSSVIAAPAANTTYTITGTDAIGCTGLAELPLTVFPLPLIQAVPDSILTCTGLSVILNATGGISYTWSPVDYLNNTHDSAVISNPLSNIVYTVTGTDENGCMNRDSVSVKTIHGTPVVVSPIADTLCAGQSTILIASGVVSYEWSPATGLSVTTGDMIIATPGTTTTYTVTGIDSNGCTSSATTLITVNPPPNISVSDNVANCVGSSTVLTAGGGIRYTWSPSSGLSATTGGTVTASPTTNMTYIVLGENEYGCSDFNTVTVSVGSELSLHISPDSTGICKGSFVTLNASGADNYFWSPSGGLNTVTGSVVTANPGFTTTYTITGSDANGCTGDTTITITVHPNPVITAGSYSVCFGDSVLLSATGAVNYTWMPSYGLSGYTGSSVAAKPTTTTTYTITGVSSFGCTDTTTSVITINPVPQVTITAHDSLVCGGSSPIYLSASPVGGIFNGMGVTGNTFYPDRVIAGIPTVIQYSYTNPSGCSGADSMTVTVYPSPLIKVTPNAGEICINSSTPLSASGADTYQWKPATGLSSTNDSLVIASPGITTTYTVIGLNASGCIDSANVTVKVNPLPDIQVSSSVTSICNGSSATLTATGSDNYLWTPSIGLNTATGATVIANPSATTTYSVYGTDTLGCSSAETAIVNVGAPVRIINTPTNPVVCEKDSVTIMLAGAAFYTWTPSTGLSATTGANISASPSVTTSYTVTGIDSNGCTGWVSFEIKVNPSLQIIGYTTAICKGNSATLNATGAGMFMWNSDSTLSSLFSATVTATPSISTTYVVTGWNSYGCSDTAQFSVTVHPSPVVSFSGLKLDYCIMNGADTLTGIPSGGTFTGKGVNGNLFYPQTAGIGGHYPVTYSYTDLLGCSDSITQYVNVNSEAVITVTPSSSNICSGSSANLSASGADNYIWTPATGLNMTTGASVTATPTVNTTYKVTGTDMNGCSGIATAAINTGKRIPVIVSSDTDSLCTGSSAVLSASGANNYEWIPSTGLNVTTGSSVVATPFATTTYTITGYDAGGCTGDTTLIVIVKPLPVVSMNNVTICAGSAAALIPSGAAYYQWSPGNSTGDSLVVSPDSTTSYFVTGTTNGCSNTAIATVTVVPLPIVSVNNVSVCQGDTAVLTAAGAMSYLWSNGETTGSISVSVTGTSVYTVTGHINTCKDSAKGTVTVNAKPVVSLTGLNPDYCSAAMADTLVGLPAGGFYEGKGVNGNYFYPSNAGIGGPYTVKYIYTTPSGCTDSVVQHTVVNSGALVTATPANPIICFNASVNLNAAGGISYSWLPSTGLSSTTGNAVTASPKTTTTYTVTGINAEGCSGSSVVTVQVRPNPVLHIISNNPAICLGSSSNINASGADNFVWSPSFGLNTVTGSSVIAAPQATTTYSVTGTDANGCSSFTTTIITVNPVPSVTASSENRLLCYQASTILTANGAGKFTWSPSTGLSSTTGSVISATPLSGLTYTVTGINEAGCTAADTVSIRVNPPVVLNIHSSDDVICFGDSALLNVTGAVNYSWVPSTGLNSTSGSIVTATPASSVTYTVTGFDTNGCSAELQSVVEVNPLPAVVISSSTSSICAEASAALTASGALSYFWNPSTGLNTTSGNFITAIPASSLTYTVTGIDVNGCSAQNHISLAVHPKPVFNISVNDPVICSGTSTILSADGILNYHWSPATGLNSTTGATVTASPLNTSSYTVTGTDLNGCSSSATAIVKIQPNPEITVELSTSSLCSGQSVRIQSGGALAYEWAPSTGLSSTTGSTVTASPSFTTTYHIKGTDTMGCSNSASVTVVVHPIPEVTFLPFNPVVCRGNSVPITVNGAAAYSWFPSTGLSSTSGSTVMASPTANTTYSITGTDTNGCTGSALATVEAGDVVALSVTSSQPILCEGQVAQLSAAGADYYHWFPSTGLNATTGNEVTANPSSSQAYTVTGINKSGCADTASIILSVHINPVVTVSMDAAICTGSSAPLNATGDGSFSWAPGISLSYPFIPNPTASPSVTTTYTVRVTNTVGCVTADSVVVTVHKNPAVDAGRDTLICKGDFIHLQGRGERYFKWLPQDFLSDSRISDPVCTPSYNITYTLTVTDEFGCSNIDTVQIFLKDSLNIHASPGATVCEGGVVQLFATGGNSYKWTPQEGLDNPYIANPIASPLQTTSYTVTSSDGICFTASDVSVVTVNPQPYLSVSTDAEIVSGQNYQLHAYGSDNGVFTWSPPDFLSCTHCPNPTVIHPDKPMTYTVTMVDSNGCRREGDVKISLTCSDDAVYVPDAFTPNGDRRNDIFRVRSYGLQHVTYFRVFSRWGELVFETTDLNQGWDGTFKDQLCSPAVYVWYLEGVCSDGSAILKKGNVTLIR